MEFLVHMFMATHGLATLFLIPLVWVIGASWNLANLTCEKVTEWETRRKS